MMKDQHLRSAAPIEPIKGAIVLNQRAHPLSLVRQRKQMIEWLQSDLLGHWIRCLWGLVREPCQSFSPPNGTHAKIAGYNT